MYTARFKVYIGSIYTECMVHLNGSSGGDILLRAFCYAFFLIEREFYRRQMAFGIPCLFNCPIAYIHSRYKL